MRLRGIGACDLGAELVYLGRGVELRFGAEFEPSGGVQRPEPSLLSLVRIL